MARNWYALRTKPNKETLVWQQAQIRGFNIFYPRIRVNPINPRSRKVLPYFPGYLFIEVDLAHSGLSTFQYMPYTLGLVCFGGEPAQIPESFIYEMRRRLPGIDHSDGMFVDHLNHGDRIFIQDGPFSGYEAIFDMRLSGHDRVRILLNMLSDRQVSVELCESMISKVRG
jgi:transcription antitermination factor NusG